MIIKQSITDVRQPGDPEHDLSGDAVQTHELPSGELLITFSDEFIATMGWQVGDTMVWEISESTGALSITCPEAAVRKDLQKQPSEDEQE